MKVCMRCGLLYWDQSDRCIICEKKLNPKVEKRDDPALEKILRKYSQK